MQIQAIVLCAGKGTRMKTQSPKVVQKILGYEMVNYVLSALNKAGIKKNTLVVGYEKKQVLDAIDNYKFQSVEQKEQLGTGHAIKVCKKAFKGQKGLTVVTYGDAPLVTAQTFQKLIKKHKRDKNAMTILTANIQNPTGYGRIIRNDVGSVSEIVEEKDASEKIKQITEINSGIYCFDTELLFKYIDKIDQDNNQGEYYLTQLVEIFNNKDLRVSAYVCDEVEEIYGVNDLPSLNIATKIMQKRINTQFQINGVNIIDSSTTYIGPKVKIGQGVIIEPHNVIEGEVEIGALSHLQPSNTIRNAKIGKECLIGPSAHIHTNSKIGNNCKIGNFVEVKNSKVDNDSKAAHLTYLGDSKIGKNVNIGCGVITANYDGTNKHQSIIGDDCFIGSNVTLIAPIKIQKGSLIAAGSTISVDTVVANSLVIARSREVIKKRKGSKSKEK